MENLISKNLIKQAIKLSSEWNNTGFIVINDNGSLDATVWNHWKWEDPQREVIAYVNGNDGFVVESEDYVLEIDPTNLI